MEANVITSFGPETYSVTLQLAKKPIDQVLYFYGKVEIRCTRSIKSLISC